MTGKKATKKRIRKPVGVPADGTLLREDGDPVVYVMHGGQRRPFAGKEAFLAYNGGWSGIVVLPHKDVDPIPVGEIVTDRSYLQQSGVPAEAPTEEPQEAEQTADST